MDTFIWCFSFAEYALVKIIFQVLTVNPQMPGTAEKPIKQSNIRDLQRKLQGATANRETPTERQWLLRQENSGRVIREKIIVVQLLKKYPIFFWLPQFIGVITRVRHSTLCWTRLVQFIPWHTTVLSARLHQVFQVAFSLVSPANMFESLNCPTRATNSSSSSAFYFVTIIIGPVEQQ